MENLELLHEGAEAKIFKKNQAENISIIKERIAKTYRLNFLNNLLIPSRTRREVKILQKLSNLVRIPKLISTNKKDIIEMEFIEGEKIRDVLDNKVNYAVDIGTILAKIHDENIIHGDLTTSNMILDKDKKICLIDFGLSQFSNKLEDKAVDIHLFKQALESKHHLIFDEAYSNFLKGYSNSKNYKQVLERLKQVESRGRNIKK